VLQVTLLGNFASYFTLEEVIWAAHARVVPTGGLASFRAHGRWLTHIRHHGLCLGWRRCEGFLQPNQVQGVLDQVSLNFEIQWTVEG